MEGTYKSWTPDSYKTLPIKQQPEYEDEAALAKALAKVEKLPPIVHQMEIEKLKSYLALACEGKMFLLQVRPLPCRRFPFRNAHAAWKGGDCAERFDECCQETIEKKFKILLQMSLIVIWESRLPVVRYLLPSLHSVLFPFFSFRSFPPSLRVESLAWPGSSLSRALPTGKPRRTGSGWPPTRETASTASNLAKGSPTPKGA
jgi:hypothetical protein